MSTDRYRVTNSEDLGDRFQQLALLAREEGRLPIFLTATKWVLEELARTPHEFGEFWYKSARSGLTYRRGFARPLFVRYAIHDGERLVFVQRVALTR